MDKEELGVSGDERDGLLDVPSFWEGVMGVTGTGDPETSERLREERRRRVWSVGGVGRGEETIVF